MKKIFILVSILMISACAPKVELKGNENELCLENGSCNSDNLICNSNNFCETCGSSYNACCDGKQCSYEYDFCNPEGFCESCGSEGSGCCPGEKCYSDLVCNNDNQCSTCGMEGESCCPEAEDQCLDGTCNNNNICVNELCDENGDCQPCGDYDEACCEVENCKSGFLCNEQTTCEYCGELFTPPCKNNQCNGWYIPINDECRDPFDEDPSYDASVCQNLDPGYESSIGRDWCLWSAAFKYRGKQWLLNAVRAEIRQNIML
jgi:hypothetical protein